MLDAIKKVAEQDSRGNYFIYGIGALRKNIKPHLPANVFRCILARLRLAKLIYPEVPIQQMSSDTQEVIRRRYRGDDDGNFAFRFARGHGQVRCIPCYMDRIKMYRSELAKSVHHQSKNGNNTRQRLRQ
ncbi:MAG TPA: hypothetical protein VJC11_03060 [Patescibacteria group bacterium]|nr:hypothetical protein [Patescibacteria group bacterium]